MTSVAGVQRALLEDLRDRVFGVKHRSRRIGAEIEWIPVLADTRRIAPVFGTERQASLGMLRRLGARLGWQEASSAKEVPYFLVPGAGTITFEPGGQIEYGSLAFDTASGLLAQMRLVDRYLREAALESGLELLAVGIDPANALEAAPLQLRSSRYERMATHFERLGGAGGRMMRQTASLQIALDFEADPWPRWRQLNQLAPFLIAIFANSPRYAGRDTGHQSFRQDSWRRLDAGRTGIPFVADDPVQGYLDFALGATPLLLDEPTDRPLSTVLERRDLTGAEWETHLSTLFPEIRPRGYLEVRSIDALSAEWYAAPIAFVSGLLYDRTSREEAIVLLGEPTDQLLVRAGYCGMRDPQIARRATELFELALAGCRRLGRVFLNHADYEVARQYFETYTRKGLSPADDSRVSLLAV